MTLFWPRLELGMMVQINKGAIVPSLHSFTDNFQTSIKAYFDFFSCIISVLFNEVEWLVSD